MSNINGTYLLNGNTFASVDDKGIHYRDLNGTSIHVPKNVLLDELNTFSHNVKRASITGKVTPVSLAVASIIS